MKALYDAETKWPIRKLCKLLRVNRAWFYRQPKRAQEKARKHGKLVKVSLENSLEFPGYGYRQVAIAL